MKVFGVEFAPLRIPLHRRLEVNVGISYQSIYQIESLAMNSIGSYYVQVISERFSK